MKKEKGFIIHEMRTLRWFLLIGVLFVLIACSILHSNVDMYLSMGNYHEGVLGSYYESAMIPGNYFSEALDALLNQGHFVVAIAFAILTLLQFADVHKKKTQEYMGSLPFTNKKRMMIKVILGLIIITVLCLLFGIGVCLVREANIAKVERAIALSPCYEQILATETIWHTLRSLILFWITLMAVYLIYVFVHCLVEQMILASVMGLGVLMAPIQIVWFLGRIASIYFYDTEGEFLITDQVRRYGAIFFGGNVSAEPMFVYTTNSHMDEYVHLVDCRETSEWLITLGILAVCIIGCMVAVYHISKKRDLAKSGTLIPLRWARVLFSVGISICVATTVVGAFAMPEKVPVLIVILLCVCAALYFGLMKIFKINVK